MSKHNDTQELIDNMSRVHTWHKDYKTSRLVRGYSLEHGLNAEALYRNGEISFDQYKPLVKSPER